MVRYTKNLGDRPYRRKFPGFQNRKHMETFLSALSRDEFGVLQKFAHHFLGTEPMSESTP